MVRVLVLTIYIQEVLSEFILRLDTFSIETFVHHTQIPLIIKPTVGLGILHFQIDQIALVINESCYSIPSTSPLSLPSSLVCRACPKRR